MPDFLSDGNSNVCFIFHHLQDIHKSIKCYNFYLENEGQVQGVEKWTCAIRLEMSDFI